MSALARAGLTTFLAFSVARDGIEKGDTVCAPSLTQRYYAPAVGTSRLVRGAPARLTRRRGERRNGRPRGLPRCGRRDILLCNHVEQLEHRQVDAAVVEVLQSAGVTGCGRRVWNDTRVVRGRPATALAGPHPPIPRNTRSMFRRGRRTAVALQCPSGSMTMECSWSTWLSSLNPLNAASWPTRKMSYLQAEACVPREVICQDVVVRRRRHVGRVGRAATTPTTAARRSAYSPPTPRDARPVHVLEELRAVEDVPPAVVGSGGGSWWRLRPPQAAIPPAEDVPRTCRGPRASTPRQ